MVCLRKTSAVLTSALPKEGFDLFSGGADASLEEAGLSAAAPIQGFGHGASQGFDIATRPCKAHVKFAVVAGEDGGNPTADTGDALCQFPDTCRSQLRFETQYVSPSGIFCGNPVIKLPLQTGCTEFFCGKLLVHLPGGGAGFQDLCGEGLGNLPVLFKDLT